MRFGLNAVSDRFCEDRVKIVRRTPAVVVMEGRAIRHFVTEPNVAMLWLAHPASESCCLKGEGNNDPRYLFYPICNRLPG
jgi:hypothetical protein